MIKILLFLFFCLDIVSIFSNSDESNFKFRIFKNCPIDVRYFEFNNGLKSYMVKNTKTPSVKMAIVYKIGSKHDPHDNTGLAHYLEHMMFKGTEKIGVIDFKKEKQILDKIEELFEKHKNEKNNAKKDEIYKEIDKLSVEAAKYSISNEFQNMLENLGATEVNAHTNFDTTVFTLDIPKNNLEKAFKIMNEQLVNPIFRRFHSELESVYEEYSNNNENAFTEVFNRAYTELIPNHPYRNPIIGKPEHLKNPSIKAIKKQFEKYYVPNNCCIILVGDIDFTESAKLIDKYFGKLKNKEIPKFTFKQDKMLKTNKEEDIFTEKGGEFSMYFYMYADKENMFKYDFIMNILNKFLHDELILKQKVDNCFCENVVLEDYTYFYLFVAPLNGQSMESAKKIVLEKINEFCLGKFDDYYFKAIKNSDIYTRRRINDYKHFTFVSLVETYSLGKDYQEVVDEKEYLLSKFTKKDVITYINKLLKNKYLCINKRIGNRDFPKIEKNRISEIELNSGKKSSFREEIDIENVSDIEPQIIDFNKVVHEIKINDFVSAYYIKPNDRKYFRIRFLFNCGRLNEKRLSFLSDYIRFSRSKQYSFVDLNKKITELGSSIRFSVFDDCAELEMQGLIENFERTLMLFSEYILDVDIDDSCIESGTKDILNYFYFNKANRIIYKNYNDFLNTEINIKTIKKYDVKNFIEKLLSAKCEILFDSSENFDMVVDIIKRSGIINKCRNVFKCKNIEYNIPRENKIYVRNSVGSQNVKCYFHSVFNKLKYENNVLRDFFNEYVRNVMWNKTREQTGLTYSSEWSIRRNGKFRNKSSETVLFSTQPGKFNEAFDVVFNTIKSLEKDRENYKLIEKKIGNEYNALRYDDFDILELYISNKRNCINVKKTNSHEIYWNGLKKMSFDRLMQFYVDNLKNNPRYIFINGDIEKININILSKYGDVEILD